MKKILLHYAVIIAIVAMPRLPVFSIYRGAMIFLTFLTLFLSACSTTQQGDSKVFELNKNYIEENLCLGMYEAEYQLSNGSGYAAQEYYQLADGRRINLLRAPCTYPRGKTAGYYGAKNQKRRATLTSKTQTIMLPVARPRGIAS